MTWPKKIRKLLREESDGMTIKELSQILDAPSASIYGALFNMPDAYIDRWTEANQYQPAEQVWCVVVPPENCPRPEPKKKEAHD